MEPNRRADLEHVSKVFCKVCLLFFYFVFSYQIYTIYIFLNKNYKLINFFIGFIFMCYYIIL